MQTVMLGVPARDPWLCAAFTESYGATIYQGLASGITVHFQPLIGQNYVDDAQNALCAMFLESECDDLVIMGDDQGWNPEHFVRLCQYDQPIVGVGVRKKTDTEDYTVALKPRPLYTADGLLPLHKGEGVGSGYLRLRRDAVETMAEKADWYYLTRCKLDVPNLFERKRHGTSEKGNPCQSSEDFNFCWKAQEAGIQIYVDPEIDTNHTGWKTWSGNMGEYWRRVNAAEIAAQSAA